jgi:hypothetical protein
MGNSSILKRIKGTVWLIACFLVLIYLAGCHTNGIQLEKVYQTSDRLECHKVFSVTRKQIVELNEILIQTGTTEAPDNRTINAAVIHVKGREILLNRLSVVKSGDKFKELYTGEGYKLALNYQLKKLQNSITYKGYCELWQDKLYNKINVEGIRSNL